MTKKVKVIRGEYLGKIGTLTGMYWCSGMCTVALDNIEYSLPIKDVCPAKENESL